MRLGRELGDEFETFKIHCCWKNQKEKVINIMILPTEGVTSDHGGVTSPSLGPSFAKSMFYIVVVHLRGFIMAIEIQIT